LGDAIIAHKKYVVQIFFSCIIRAMNTQHTPGPWDFGFIDSLVEGGHIAVSPEYDNEKDDDDETRANGGCNIAICLGPDKFANARLIMVAPEILLALECLVDACPPVNRNGMAAHKNAIALIAMARGEDDA
jgi:hypothetical protein